MRGRQGVPGSDRYCGPAVSPAGEPAVTARRPSPPSGMARSRVRPDSRRRRECFPAGCAAVTHSTFRDVPWNGLFYRKHGFRDLQPSEWTPGMRANRENRPGAGGQ